MAKAFLLEIETSFGIGFEIGPEIGFGFGYGIGPVIKCVSGASFGYCFSPCPLT